MRGRQHGGQCGRGPQVHPLREREDGGGLGNRDLRVGAAGGERRDLLPRTQPLDPVTDGADAPETSSPGTWGRVSTRYPSDRALRSAKFTPA